MKFAKRVVDYSWLILSLSFLTAAALTVFFSPSPHVAIRWTGNLLGAVTSGLCLICATAVVCQTRVLEREEFLGEGYGWSMNHCFILMCRPDFPSEQMGTLVAGFFIVCLWLVVLSAFTKPLYPRYGGRSGKFSRISSAT